MNQTTIYFLTRTEINVRHIRLAKKKIYLRAKIPLKINIIADQEDIKKEMKPGQEKISVDILCLGVGIIPTTFTNYHVQKRWNQPSDF